MAEQSNDGVGATRLLDSINSPTDLAELADEQLQQVAQ